ncbi:MAG: bifunctional 4-hydroxy-2-oxoglutarate aldolase/2-dehydro-3-deoxy-phosphogluconate aldolase [Beijerinckiaceae bacterium]
MSQISPNAADFRTRAAAAGVIPVVTIDRLEQAVPLARALVDGGLPIIEVTLRTRVALDAMTAMAEQVRGALVGAGTVLTPEQGQQALKAGARFMVSPGATDRLIAASKDWPVPFLPGCATASEAMRLAEQRISFVKLFPAESVGGAGLLKSLSAPLPHITFCPTGGITAAKAPDYLALPNVTCVGGSWMTPAAAIAAGDWDAVRALAAAASRLRATA